jgi:hypothetical protein
MRTPPPPLPPYPPSPPHPPPLTTRDRGDHKAKETEGGAQSFMRSTTKYVLAHTHTPSPLPPLPPPRQPPSPPPPTPFPPLSRYWVNTEDVSKVKYAVLQHLPVFLQKTATGETDSQLTNSVYLDNTSLELYHGRLDKTPGAIAARLRWYVRERSEGEGGALLRRKRALFCGGSRRCSAAEAGCFARGLSGGDPPNPPCGRRAERACCRRPAS